MSSLRTFDAEAVNAIANTPDVRATMFLGALYPPQHLDFTPYVDDHRNVALVQDGFASIFVFRGPGIYECHIMVRGASRGASAMMTARAMLNHMRDAGAKMIWGQPSIHNRAAVTFIRRMGLTPAGFGVDPVAGDVQYFEMAL